MNFLTDDEFNKFKEKIYKESGIHFSTVNRPILESRIKERFKYTNVENTEEYYKLINNNQNELMTLLDSVTTNLTKFFRNEAQFESLEKNVLPEIIERKKNANKTIKIWSAGCSTGEEPYTVAMTLLNILPNIYGWNLKIIASDISLKSLMIAQKGIYERERIENIDEKNLQMYFNKKDENNYEVKKELKDLIQFDYHNLKHDAGHKDIDIIFCRNVIIYFDREAQINVIKKFYDVLDEKGYLFIGHSESLFGMNTGFKFTKIGNSCVYKKS